MSRAPYIRDITDQNCDGAAEHRHSDDKPGILVTVGTRTHWRLTWVVPQVQADPGAAAMFAAASSAKPIG